MSAPAGTLSAVVYPLAWEHLGRGRFGDLLTCDLRVALLSSAYTPADTNRWWGDIADNEISGPGYATDGQPVTGRALAYDAGIGRAPLNCFTVSWPAAAFTCRYAVAYVIGDNPDGNPLLSRVDLGADLHPAGSDLDLTFSSGLVRIGPGTPPA